MRSETYVNTFSKTPHQIPRYNSNKYNIQQILMAQNWTQEPSKDEWIDPTKDIESPTIDFDTLFPVNPQFDKTSTPMIAQASEPSEPSESSATQEQEKRVRKGRDTKVSKKNDVTKCIPAYVGGKVLHAFTGHSYPKVISRLCRKHGLTLREAQEVYRPYLKQRFLGLTLLHSLLVIRPAMTQLQVKACLVFKTFYEWYIRNIYMRYLLVDGRMDQKDQYISVKNKTLLYLGEFSQEDMKPNSV